MNTSKDNITNREKVLGILNKLEISYDIYKHPPVPTVEEALPYWNEIDATHCKNLFFRNHKGNRHYLVVLRHTQQLMIRDLEQRLKQGKISFASPQRMDRYLGLSAGSVSAFGVLNDVENHVYLFLDAELKTTDRISFHPNENSSTVVVSMASFIKFLKWSGNSYQFLTLYDK